MSRIVEKEVDGLEGGIYSLFFDTIAKVRSSIQSLFFFVNCTLWEEKRWRLFQSFRRFQNDEQLTASMWLVALTSANRTVAEVSGISVGDRTLLDVLIPVELKLKEALDSGLNPVDAFAEAVNAAETSAMQTVNSPIFPDSTNHKVSCRKNIQQSELKII